MVLLIDGQKHSHQTCFHQENVCPLKLMYTPLNPTFIFFDPKHTLWVLVRTASARWF